MSYCFTAAIATLAVLLNPVPMLCLLPDEASTTRGLVATKAQ